MAEQILHASDELQTVSDRDLLQQARSLRANVGAESELNRLLPVAFALVREASRRAHQQSHYEVQLVAGIGLFESQIVEMQTGEGKTLAALLPAFLHALVGKGVHVVTANDYLAQRDAEFASAVFQRLGVSVGCLDESVPREQRGDIYEQDITYGTAREFGFDYLKDRLAIQESSTVVQRGHYFALVDEADSVLIDDARTPLLIAGKRESTELQQRLTRVSNQISQQIQPQRDFELDHNLRSATLTETGCRSVLKNCPADLLRQLGPEKIYQQVENSLCANFLFQQGRHYVLIEQEVAIVDESTGRIADGRQWQRGLQQAIEAKEEIEIGGGTATLAKITVQSYFRMYRQLAGLTGTAQPVAREFKKVFDRSVLVVPTRRPSQRQKFTPRIFRRYDDKLRAVAHETQQRMLAGQSVLIGTPSVQASMRVSDALNEFSIPHNVLNCVEHEQESTVVQRAGTAGQVTVATNMAGRGTDIEVEPAVLAAGGLHIIGTEMHSSSRIDRQLIGRAARQGQPGSYQFFLSLQDELFVQLGEPISISANATNATELPARMINIFQKAQQKLEKLHGKQRLDLLGQEKRRTKLCRQIGLEACLEMIEDAP